MASHVPGWRPVLKSKNSTLKRGNPSGSILFLETENRHEIVPSGSLARDDIVYSLSSAGDSFA
eukprot:gene23328-1433_t